MKKLTSTAALFVTMAATSALAHHPAADIVDPEIYSMIDENVADTPHADLVLDDMGSAMDQAVTEPSSPQMSRAGAIVSVDDVMETANAVDTMGLMEDVAGTLAE